MLKFVLALTVLGPVLCLRGAPSRAFVSAKVDSWDQGFCKLSAAPVVDDALALVLPGEAKDANSTVTLVGKAPTKAQRAELDASMSKYKAIKEKMMKAQGRVMSAMEKILEVPSVTGAELTALVDQKEKDTLVVFYAPWCGHCQTFVLHKNGDPTKAPLEVFNRDLKAAGAHDTLNIVRFDVQEHGKEIPAGFDVQGIPAMYLVAAGGKKVPYPPGGPSDAEALKSFITSNADKTKGLGGNLMPI